MKALWFDLDSSFFFFCCVVGVLGELFQFRSAIVFFSFHFLVRLFVRRVVELSHSLSFSLFVFVALDVASVVWFSHARGRGLQ